jgi:sec-independent protein translocase protein TatC
VTTPTGALQETLQGALADAGSWLGWLGAPVPYSSYPWWAVLGLLLGVALAAGLTAVWGIPWARRWWADETPREGEDERGVSLEEMTLQGHLLELRNRLVISLIGLAVTTAVACIFYRTWFDIAVWPIRGRGNCAAVTLASAVQGTPAGAAGAVGPLATAVPTCLQAITPTELIFSYFSLALVVGFILAMPVIAYEAWSYVAPGLTRQERRYVLAVVPGATLSFVAGVSFAYFALMPAALGFLLGFSQDVEIRPTVASYVSFLSHLLIAIGLIFELPLVMFFLAKVHLITPKLLSGIRRYVIVAAFIVAAVVTPTPDPFNQLLVALPVMLLYEVGVLLARIA